MTTQQDPTTIAHPVIKTCVAWGCAAAAKVAEAGTVMQTDSSWHWLNALPWGDLAQVAAFLGSAAVLGEWVWKKIVRPLGERIGWVKPRRREITESEWADMRPRRK